MTEGWQDFQTIINCDPEGVFEKFSENIVYGGSEKWLVAAVDAFQKIAKPNLALALIKSAFAGRPGLSSRTILDLLYLQADCLFDLDQLGDSIMVYDLILASTQRAAAYANRGLSKEYLGDKGGAMADYLEAISLDPCDSVAHRNLGALLNRLDRPEEALLYLNTAIDLDPHSARACTELGIAYFNMGAWLEAHRFVKKALSLDPENRLAKLGLEKIEQSFSEASDPNV